jgi:Transposase and inactivated derivatives
MERMLKGMYPPEFRTEAVKLVGTMGLSVAQAAKQLSMPNKSSLENWVRALREGKLEGVGKGHRVPSELEMELSRARKERAEVRQERDLLKRCVVYFAKESR